LFFDSAGKRPGENHSTKYLLLIMKFPLQDHDHITLNNLLKVLNLVETGGEANVRITSGEVKVNGTIELQKRKKLRPGDIIEFQKQKITIE